MLARRFFSVAANSTKTNPQLRYRIVASTILKRNPVILRSPSDLEKSMHQYRSAQTVSQSVPYDAAFFDPPRVTAPSSPKKTGDQKKEEDTIRMMQEIETGLRETEADRKNDVKSLDRKLDRSLYLIVKKARQEHAWQFPQGGVEGDEALHEAAQRELKEECGDQLITWFIGRAPVGVYSYKFPQRKSEYDGAKVFFMKAHILSGSVKVDGKEIVDYAWVTKEELPKYVDEAFFEAVKDCLSNQ